MPIANVISRILFEEWQRNIKIWMNNAFLIVSYLGHQRGDKGNGYSCAFDEIKGYQDCLRNGHKLFIFLKVLETATQEPMSVL